MKGALSEEKLIALLQRADKDSFNYLYDNYSSALYGSICRMVTDKHLAEDVLQDVFLKVWSRFHQYTPSKGRLFTWMNSIARNSAIDLTRGKRGAQREYEVSGIDSDSITTQQNTCTIGIDSFIHLLSKHQRDVVCLHYYSGLSLIEISEALGMPLGSVKTRLRQAMRKFREIYHNDIPAQMLVSRG